VTLCELATASTAASPVSQSSAAAAAQPSATTAAAAVNVLSTPLSSKPAGLCSPSGD